MKKFLFATTALAGVSAALVISAQAADVYGGPVITYDVPATNPYDPHYPFHFGFDSFGDGPVSEFNLTFEDGAFYWHAAVDIHSSSPDGEGVQLTVKADVDGDLNDLYAAFSSSAGSDGLLSADELETALSPFGEIDDGSGVVDAFLTRYGDTLTGSGMTPSAVLGAMMAESFLLRKLSHTSTVTAQQVAQLLPGDFDHQANMQFVNDLFANQQELALSDVRGALFSYFGQQPTEMDENIVFGQVVFASGADGIIDANDLSYIGNLMGTRNDQITQNDVNILMQFAFAQADADNTGEVMVNDLIEEIIVIVTQEISYHGASLALEDILDYFPTEIINSEALLAALNDLSQDSFGNYATTDVKAAITGLARDGEFDLSNIDGFEGDIVFAQLQRRADVAGLISIEDASSIIETTLIDLGRDLDQAGFDSYLQALSDLADADGKVPFATAFSMGSAFNRNVELAGIAAIADPVTVGEFLSDKDYPYSDAERAAFVDALGGEDALLTGDNLDVFATQGAKLFGTVDFEQLETSGHISAGVLGVRLESETDDILIMQNADIYAGNTGVMAFSGSGAAAVQNTGYFVIGSMDSYENLAPMGLAAVAATDAIIENSGNIELQGHGIGIIAVGGDGDVEITNSGDIAASVGIWGVTAGGDVTIQNSGDINGTSAMPFTITAGAQNYSDMLVGSQAGIVAVATSSSSLMFNGSLIDFEGSAESHNAIILNSGDITFGDDQNAVSKLTGILAAADDRAAILNSGDISIDALDSMGGAAFSLSGQAVFENSGNINVTGEGGIFASGQMASVINTGFVHLERNWSMDDYWNPAVGTRALDGNALVENDGVVQASGYRMRGIYADAEHGTSTILNNGTVRAFGDEGHAIFAEGQYVALSNGEDGTISTKGNSAGGVVVHATSDAVIDNDGAIATSGGDAAHAVRIAGTGKLTFNNTGSVNSASGHGVRISDDGAEAPIGEVLSTSAEAMLFNSGSIVGGTDSFGVYVRNVQSFHAVNAATGTIQSSGLAAIAAENMESFSLTNAGQVAGLYVNETDKFEVLTSGTISQGITVTAGEGSLTNVGTISGGGSILAGSLDVENSGTMSGQFDLSGEGELALTLSSTSMISEAVFNSGLGTDSVQFNGNIIKSDQFIGFEKADFASGMSMLDGDATFSEMVEVSGGMLKLTDGSSLATDLFTIGTAGTFGGAGTVNGDVVNNGLIELAATDDLIVNGDLTSEEGSTIRFALGGTNGTPHSSITVNDGSFTYANGDVLDVNVYSGVKLDGSEIEIATAEGGIDNLATQNDSLGVEISDNSAAYGFESFIRGNSLLISAKATIAAAVSFLNPDLKEKAIAVEGLVTSGRDDRLVAALNGMDEQELTRTVGSLTSESPATQSSITAASPASSTFSNLAPRIASRVSRNTSSSSASNAYAPQSFGNKTSTMLLAYGQDGSEQAVALSDDGALEAWAQIYGSSGSFGTSDRSGYGGSAGLDLVLGEGVLIGAGLSYSRSFDESVTGTADASTIGGLIYGAKEWENGIQLAGSAGYYRSSVDSSRTVLATVNAASFDIDVWTADATVSKEIALSGITLTPAVALKYANISTSGYTETGGIAPMTVSGFDRQTLDGTARLTVAHDFQTQGAVITPNATVGLSYEFLGEGVTRQAAFVGGNPFDLNAPNTPRVSYNLGAGVTIKTDSGLSLEAAYSGTFADDFEDHLFRSKLKVPF